MDAGLGNSGPESLFFTGSDDEVDDTTGDLDPVNHPSGPLFLVDSEEESPWTSTANEGSHSESVSKNLSTSEEARGSSGDDDAYSLPQLSAESPPPFKKRRVSPSPTSSVSRPHLNAIASASKTQNSTSPTGISPKRPYQGPQNNVSFYLGSFIVANAWATVKGSGFVKIGDEISIEREDQDEEKHGFKDKAGRQVNRDAKDKGKKRQLTLTSMMKSHPSKASTKKVDSIVRLTNGLGFGRFQLNHPQNTLSLIILAA
jgi:DNA repair protein RAD5